MKLQQLRFLLAVVDNGLNITAASEALFTSQPGVSKQIRLLEDELDVKLFVRNGKRIDALTPAGEKAVTRARRILEEVERIKKLSAEIRDEQHGELSLATTHTQARYVLPPLVGRFRERFPDVDFAMHQGTSEQIAAMVEERRVDFVIASGGTAGFPRLVTVPMYQWDRVVVVPGDHPLARHERLLDLRTLAEYPLVTYLFSDRPESSLMTAFREQGLAPRIAFTARDGDIIKTYVRTGMGVGVLASMAVEQGADDDLRVLDARGLFPRLTTWVGFQPDLLLTRYHRAFLELLAPLADPDALSEPGEWREPVTGVPLRGGAPDRLSGG